MITRKVKIGFTLIETLLVLGIAAFAGFVAFSQIVKNQENNKASYAGMQIKQIGEAVNAYISNHYDTLSSLTNASGSSSDLGPRTCTSATNNCTITITTLTNEGLLPSTYSGKNVYGFGYSIILKRTGTSPYYKINGLITTDATLKTGATVRYDLLGQSMQAAGIDSGMTRDSSSVVSGFNGSWSENYTNFSNISKLGLLAYQAGYGTYNYSVFLRRDGTLPMTGSLNMGSNDITNAKDYTGSGNITTGGNISAGGEVSAKNAYGDTITMGGDNYGNDYEIRLGSNKALSIHGPSSVQVNVNGSLTSALDLEAGRTITAGGEVIVHNGYGDAMSIGGDAVANDFDIKLSGKNYLGFLNTERTPITLGVNGKVFVRPSSGEPTNGNRITLDSADGSISTTGRIGTQGLNPNEMPPGFGAGGIRTVDVIATGSFYSIQAGTNISEGKYAFYARQDGNVSASGNINAGGSLNATGGVNSNGRITTNEFLQLNRVAVQGAGCSPNGVVGRDANGTVLNCSSGTWKAAYNPIITVRDDGQWGSDADWQYCNSDEVVIAGGGDCQDPAHHFIHASSPSGNGWVVNCFALPNYTDLPAHAFAICLKK